MSGYSMMLSKEALGKPPVSYNRRVSKVLRRGLGATSEGFGWNQALGRPSVHNRDGEVDAKEAGFRKWVLRSTSTVCSGALILTFFGKFNDAHQTRQGYSQTSGGINHQLR